MTRIAIIGGGPGGLMTAYRLQERCTGPFEATIYEASARTGGKVLTASFGHAAVAYEAGAAELYDYSRVGPDPLRELVASLGLRVSPMSGASIVLDGAVLGDLEDVARVHGDATRAALVDFDTMAKRWMSPQDYYDADWTSDGSDPEARRSFADVLSAVPDRTARRILQTLTHSDLATEPHRTSAAYGLQNYLMNDPSYMSLYTIEGGIEALTRGLLSRIAAEVRLREPVREVARIPGDRFRVTSHRLSETGFETIVEDYDFVVAAVPNSYLPTIRWIADDLGDAVQRHYTHFDHPAHYLRVSILFREVFWSDILRDSYFILDSFGGCCLYDESSRNGTRGYGVLGWLLAGDAAVTAANLTDDELFDLVLRSQPSLEATARKLFVEGRVHRWIGAVTGLPGGALAQDMDARHMADPERPDFFFVGDYLFDSTLNGVLDSADFVAEWIADEIRDDRQAGTMEAATR